MPQSQYNEQKLESSSPLSQSQWGYTYPESYYQPPYQHSASYTRYQDQPIEEKSDLEKSMEALCEAAC